MTKARENKDSAVIVRLDERLNNHLDKFDEKFSQLDGSLKDIKQLLTLQNGRVSNLERWRAYVIGLGVAGSVLLQEIIHGFGKK